MTSKCERSRLLVGISILQNINHSSHHTTHILHLTLPNSYHGPTSRFQFNTFLGIPLDIAFKFWNPVIRIVFGHGWRTMRAPVPKASIDEYRDMPSRITYIRFSGSLLPIQPVTRVSSFPECLPHPDLRRCSTAFIGFHGFTNAFGQRRFGRFSRCHHDCDHRSA